MGRNFGLILLLVIILSNFSLAQEVTCSQDGTDYVKINCDENVPIGSTGHVKINYLSSDITVLSANSWSLCRSYSDEPKPDEISYSNMQASKNVMIGICIDGAWGGDEISYSKFSPHCLCTITVEDSEYPKLSSYDVQDTYIKNQIISLKISAEDNIDLDSISVSFDYGSGSDSSDFITQTCETETTSCTKTFEHTYTDEGDYLILIKTEDVVGLETTSLPIPINVYTQYYKCDLDEDEHYGAEDYENPDVDCQVPGPISRLISGPTMVTAPTIKSEDAAQNKVDCVDTYTECINSYHDFSKYCPNGKNSYPSFNDDSNNMYFCFDYNLEELCSANFAQTINDEVTEQCGDFIHWDCDPTNDFPIPIKYYYDGGDHDGWGVETYDWLCEGTATKVPNTGDCKPEDPSVNPGEDEICNDGKDNDCNPNTKDVDCANLPDDEEESFSEDDYVPSSGFGTPVATNEICDGNDNDLDNLWDENCDKDGDGYINKDMICESGALCADKYGSDDGVENCHGCSNIDCVDDDFGINPGREELCDSVEDIDCDGKTVKDRVEQCYSSEPCFKLLETSNEEEIFCQGTRVKTNSNYYICECVPYLDVTDLNPDDDFEEIVSFTINSNIVYENGQSAIKVESYIGEKTNKITAPFNGRNPYSDKLSFEEEQRITYLIYAGTDQPAINNKYYSYSAAINYIPGALEETESFDETTMSTEEIKSAIDKEAENTNSNSLVKSEDEIAGSDQATLDSSYKVSEDGTETEVGHTVELGKKQIATDTTIIVEIPKCAAELVSQMFLGDSNYEIIEEDPIIAWHFTEITADQIDISYSFGKTVDKECLEQIKVGQVIQSIEDYKTNDSAPFIIFAIPVVVVLIIMLSKFTTTEKRVEISIDQHEMVKELEDIIKNRLRDGEDSEFILSELRQLGFNREHIKEAFKRKGLL